MARVTGGRADSWETAVPSLIRSVLTAANATGSNASLPESAVHSASKPVFHLCDRCYGLPQQQSALQAVDLSFPPTFLGLVHQGLRLGETSQAFLCVAKEVEDLGQHGATEWKPDTGSLGPQSGDPLLQLHQPLLALTLHRERPPAETGCQGGPRRKSVLGRERHSGLCLLAHISYVPTKLRDERATTQRIRHTEGMLQLMGQCQGILATCVSLIREPQ